MVITPASTYPHPTDDEVGSEVLQVKDLLRHTHSSKLGIRGFHQGDTFTYPQG